MSAHIPERVRQLVHEHLPTMEHVELLLFLSNAPDAAFTSAELASRMQVDGSATAARLADLEKSALVARQGTGDDSSYRFAPDGLALRQAVEQLREAYKTRPVSLIRMVYERPPESARRFADAFRLRKE